MQTRDAGMLHTTLIWETGLQSRSSRFESTTTITTIIAVVEGFRVHRSSSTTLPKESSPPTNYVIHLISKFRGAEQCWTRLASLGYSSPLIVDRGEIRDRRERRSEGGAPPPDRVNYLSVYNLHGFGPHAHVYCTQLDASSASPSPFASGPALSPVSLPTDNLTREDWRSSLCSPIS